MKRKAPTQKPYFKRGFALASVGLIALGLHMQASAATWHWTGGGNPTFNWNNSANWTNDSGSTGIPSTSGTDILVFEGAVGLQNIDDFGAGSSFAGLTFGPNASAFVITGNRISLGTGGTCGITNFSPILQTFNIELENNRNTTVNLTNGSIYCSYRFWDWTWSVIGGHDLIINQTNTANANGQILSINGVTTTRMICCAVSNGPVGLGCQIDSNGVLVACGPAQQFGTDGRNDIVLTGGSLMQIQATNFAGLPDFQQMPMVRGSNNIVPPIVENGSALGPVQLRVGLGNATRLGSFDGQVRDGAGGGALSVAVVNQNGVGAFWRLGGTNNSYTGETVITNAFTGTGASSSYSRLLVDGANLGGGVYTVVGNSAGGKSALCGSGLISANTVNILTNGFLAPGGQLTGGTAALYTRSGGLGANPGGFAESTGALTITNSTNITMNLTATNSTLDIHLFGTSAGQFDQVLMVATNGTLSNNFANLQLTVDLGYTPAPGDTFTIVKVPGTNSANNIGIFGTVNGLLLSTNSPGLIQGTNFLVGATRFAISYRGENNVFDMGAGNGNDIVIKVLEDTANKLTWNGNLSSDWDFTTTNWLDTNNLGATITNGDKAIFTDASSHPNVNLTTVVSPSTVLVKAAQDYTFISAGGYLSGQILLTKTNTGTLFISTPNDAVGYTIIDQGTVALGGPSGDGSLVTSVLVNSNGVFNFNGAGSSTVGAPSFQSSGKVIHGGSGTLTITKDYSSTWLNVTTNSGGPIQFGDAVNSLVGRFGGTLGVGPSSSVSYNFRGSQTVDHSLVGSGATTYFIGAGNQATITLGPTNRGYTGPTLIKFYTRVQASSSNACLNGPITIDTFDPDFGAGSYFVNANTITNTNSISIVGPGPSGVDTPRGKGALRLAGGWAGPITMSGNATIGASGTGVVLGNISDGGNNYTLEYLGGTSLVGPTSGVNTYGNTLIAEDYNGNYSSPVLTTVRALNANAFSTNAVRIRGRAQLELNGNNLSFPELIDLSTVDGGGSFSPTVWNNNTNIPATLTLGSDDGSQTFTGVFGDGVGATARPLGLTKVGAGTLTVSGNSTNTGPVTVSSGTLALSAAANLSPSTYTNGVAVVGGGAFGRSSVITVASLATLSVTARGNGTLTLSNGQTLTGAGTVTGVLAVPAGSTVAPAISSTSTLTVSGNVTLGGTYLASLNRGSTPNCGQLASSGGSITYGGALVVTNTGAALHAGDVFQLFAPSGASGFTSVSLPTVDLVNKYIYTWSNSITSDGKITVVSAVPVNPNPPILQRSLSGTSLQLAWPTNLGWTLWTNASGLAANNAWFPYAGSTTITNVTLTVERSKANVFFRMSY
jgi:autotransporter-associated beta strand protein